MVYNLDINSTSQNNSNSKPIYDSWFRLQWKMTTRLGLKMHKPCCNGNYTRRGHRTWFIFNSVEDSHHHTPRFHICFLTPWHVFMVLSCMVGSITANGATYHERFSSGTPNPVTVSYFIIIKWSDIILELSRKTRCTEYWETKRENNFSTRISDTVYQNLNSRGNRV